MQEERFAKIKYQIHFLFAVILMVCCLSFGSIAAKAAPKDIIATELTNEGQRVTFRVKISGNAKVTSGRIQIFYPEKLLKLSEVQNGISWRTMDTDTTLKEEGKYGISYAWADTKELADEGILLTATMDAADQAIGQEIRIETKIVELFSREEPVELKTYHISDSLTLDSEGSQPPEEPDPSVSGTAGVATTGAAASSARTGDDSNLTGCILLCMGSLLAMIDLIKKEPI